MARLSATFQPAALFSLKDSAATNSGAKSLLLPTPYAIKMALLNAAITYGDELDALSEKNSSVFAFVRDAKISYAIPEDISFCVNNTFIKILKPARDEPGYQKTVSFREYVNITRSITIVIDLADDVAVPFWKSYLHKVGYFGKQGCFFQFSGYDEPIGEANVLPFALSAGSIKPGVLQAFDDFNETATFDMVNSFSSTKPKRKTIVYLIPVRVRKSSKSFTHYKM
ncbi:hypothetical protein CLV58_10752 [Spirosoma oryzae]|uniref:Uncharacterized protein n=1 Tax=Spirosoma oryzae TaxID=1469603 RepID=A0A2T0T2V1_9BACT|nr:hypothetical protein [Spirosoma oryzae]PRY39959.1 hypothetical protein CLV58_10752 [Spirosoma oryzae]